MLCCWVSVSVQESRRLNVVTSLKNNRCTLFYTRSMNTERSPEYSPSACISGNCKQLTRFVLIFQAFLVDRLVNFASTINPSIGYGIGLTVALMFTQFCRIILFGLFNAITYRLIFVSNLLNKSGRCNNDVLIVS